MAIFPMVALGWVATLFVGSYFLNISAILFCPVELREGYQCYASWWGDVEEAYIILFAGISAIAVVTIGAIVAPFNKLFFSKVVYGLGVLLAFIMTISLNGFWIAFISSIVAGYLSVLVIKKKTNKRASRR